jgi:hypothetical protein
MNALINVTYVNSNPTFLYISKGRTNIGTNIGTIESSYKLLMFAKHKVEA